MDTARGTSGPPSLNFPVLIEKNAFLGLPVQIHSLVLLIINIRTSKFQKPNINFSQVEEVFKSYSYWVLESLREGDSGRYFFNCDHIFG